VPSQNASVVLLLIAVVTDGQYLDFTGVAAFEIFNRHSNSQLTHASGLGVVCPLNPEILLPSLN